MITALAALFALVSGFCFGYSIGVDDHLDEIEEGKKGDDDK